MTTSSRPNPKLEAKLAATEQWAQSLAFHELNAEFAVVLDSAKIVRLEPTATGETLSYTAHDFIRVICADRKIVIIVGQYKDGKTKTKTANAAEEWLGWESRRIVTTLSYRPGQPRITPDGALNLWTGWGCEPKSGDVRPYLEMVENLIPVKEQRDHFLDWQAAPIQTPGLKMSTACVIVTQVEGVGKSTLIGTMKAIYGAANVCVLDEDALGDRFGEWIGNSQLAIGEEITGTRSRQFAAKLKNLITGNQLRKNEKFRGAKQSESYTNFLFLTNDIDSFDIGPRDRRFFVVDSTAKQLPSEFYVRYAAWLKAGGASALFHFFLKRDLSKFNPYADAPMTSGKALMVAASRSDVEQWCAELFENPDAVLIMPGSIAKIPRALFTTEELLAIYPHTEFSPLKAKGMALALRKAGFNQIHNGNAVELLDKSRKRLWLIRDRDQLAKKTVPELAATYSEQMNIKAAPKPKNPGMKVVKGAHR